MISKNEIKKLADLARLEVADGEAEELASEMGAILEYIGQVKEIAGNGLEASLKIMGVGGDVNVNVMREDDNPTPSGTYSKEPIIEFPQKQEDYLKVKKIL